MTRKSLKLLWQAVKNNLCNDAKRLHYWMMEEPKNGVILDGFSVVLLGVNGLLLSELVIPTSLGDIASKPFVVAIVGIMLSIFLWAVIGILKTLTTKEISISSKYKFLSFLLFIPFQLFINKILIWLKSNYAKQNNSNN